MDPTKEVSSHPSRKVAFVKSASPKQIICVNIELYSSTGSEATKEKKVFYRREISKKLGIPVHFV